MSDDPQDQIIWNACREGSKDALEFIYENHHSALKYYGLKFKNDESLISDLIQELFIELIDSGKKLALTSNIRFYLLSALRNKLYNQFSKESKRETSKYEEFDYSIIESIESLSKKQQEIIYLRF